MLLSISASVFYPRFTFLLRFPLLISLLASPVSFFLTGTPLSLISFFLFLRLFSYLACCVIFFLSLLRSFSEFVLPGLCFRIILFFSLSLSLSLCGMEDGQLLCNIFFDGFVPLLFFFLACGCIFFSRTFSVIIFYLCLTRCPPKFNDKIQRKPNFYFYHISYIFFSFKFVMKLLIIIYNLYIFYFFVRQLILILKLFQSIMYLCFFVSHKWFFFFLYFSLSLSLFRWWVSMNSSVVMRRFVPPGTKSRIVRERSSRVCEIQVNHSNFKKCYVDCIQGNHRSPEELRFQTSFTIDEICWNVLDFPFSIVDHLKFIFAYITVLMSSHTKINK